MADSNTTDVLNNYKQPNLNSQPATFTRIVTAYSREDATKLARYYAKNDAIVNFGKDTTQFLSEDAPIVVENPAGKIPDQPGIINTGVSFDAEGTPTLISRGLLDFQKPTYTVTVSLTAAQTVNSTESGFPPPDARTSPPVTQADVEAAIAQETADQAVLAAENQSTTTTSTETTTANQDESSGFDYFYSPDQGAVQKVDVVGTRKQDDLPKKEDWRFRIHLARDAKYLYKIPGITSEDILYPLSKTHGVIFPYTPSISLNYQANYDSPDLVHTNYKIHNYRNSSVENINITGDFTAQDTVEANYLLAVIHFFRSVTKMFYGQDGAEKKPIPPVRGTPPPLCYLTGYGDFAFNEHPVVITAFTLTYPTDVDYINAGINVGGSNGLVPYNPPMMGQTPSSSRLRASNLQPGGGLPQPNFAKSPYNTRVPTKMQIQLSALPVVTRDRISNNFSLKEYATGKLMLGRNLPASYGGMW